jgi:ketosteroid isomerase-like protein
VDSENVEIMRRWWAGVNDTGMPPLELCHPAIEIVNPPEFLVRGTYGGHDGVREWVREAFDILDDLRVEVEDALDAGDGERVVTMLRLQGVAAHTRIPIDEPWAAVCRVRDGMLWRAEGYVSRRAALEAAGLRD